MSFARTWLALLAPVASAVVLALYVAGERRRRRLVGRLGELPLVRRMMAAASPGRRRIKAILMALAAGLAVLAAAGPGTHGRYRTEKRGLDLVVALDVSKSMMTPDRPPSRLSHARAGVLSLLGQLENDRVAVVVFAGGAIHFPLTEDHDVASELFTDIGPTDLPPGSDVAEALRLGRCLLRPDLYDDLGCARVGGRGHGGDPLPGMTPPDQQAKPKPPEEPPESRGKAIMVFTDGGGDPERTADEVRKARDLGIAVFWVGVGTDAGGDVPELDQDGHVIGKKRDRDGRVVHSSLERQTLVALATAGGDVHRYLDLPPAVSEPDGSRTVDARPLVEALSGLQRGSRTVMDQRREDRYHWFLFPAFLLLVIEACIGTRRRRVVFPEGES